MSAAVGLDSVRRVGWVAALAWLAVIVGCRPATGVLSVSLLSDYVVGVEVVTVRTTVLPMGGSATTPRTVTAALPVEPLTVDHAVAEIAALRPGGYDVLVELLTETGDVVQRRRVLVRLASGTTSVRVSIARSCESVTCPTEGAPSATECVAGHCVEPTCSGVTCPGMAACAHDVDCPIPSASCAESVCVDGVCLATERPGACGDGSACVPETGCAPIEMHAPATVCDPTTEPCCAAGDPSCCQPATDPTCCATTGQPACCMPGECCIPGDVDCDGYVGADDPAPNDPLMHRGAPETCGDGVDQDGDGADLPCPACVDADGDGCCAGDPDFDLDDADASVCEDVGLGGPDSDSDGVSDADEIAAGCPSGAEHTSLISPQAFEICGDGVDQDCDGHDMPLADCPGHYTQVCGAHGYCTDSPRQHLACTRAPRASRSSCFRCCVICEAQHRYHWVNVDHDCAAAAERYCARSNRGGLATGTDPVRWGVCTQ